MDWYIGIFSLLFISLIECLIVAWAYGNYSLSPAEIPHHRLLGTCVLISLYSLTGVDRLFKDIELMVGKQPLVVFKYMWKIVTPAIILVSIDSRR